MTTERQPRPRAARCKSRGLACFAAVFALLALASCQKPPQSAYVSQTSSFAAVPIGTNAAGEACTSQANGSGTAVYCGGWTQPSATITQAGPADGASPLDIARTSTWRGTLEDAYACGKPVAGTILDGVPAAFLACTQRLGGWPHLGLVAIVNNRVYEADGVVSSLPALERALGVLSGKLSAAGAGGTAVTISNSELAQQLAAEAFSSGDISHYGALMALGSQANQEEDFSAAIIAYRAALALQQERLGANDPGTVEPMLELAMNLSDSGQYPQAATVFAAAAKLAANSNDPSAPPRLLHYEGLDALNQGHYAAALNDLREAEQQYAALLPPELLRPQPITTQNAALFSITYEPGPDAQLAEQLRLRNQVTQNALLGVIETLRYQAIAEHGLGDAKASFALMAEASSIALANDIAPPALDARLERTGAAVAASSGKSSQALNDLSDAAADFATALPGSLPVAETDFLKAAVLHGEKSDPAALAACRAGIALLRNLQQGSSADLISPCLDIFAATATAQPAQAEALHAEMFEAAELTQGSETAREIGQAAARLSSSSADPKVAAAIRAQQDGAAKLAALYQERDDFTKAAANGGAGTQGETLAGIDKQIAAANAALAQEDEALQEAAPNFGQLVQQVVPARAVLKLLRPDEGFLGVTLGPEHGWLFLLHGNSVDVARSDIGDGGMQSLVSAVRASIEPSDAGVLPVFDMADAAKIYAATLGPFRQDLASIHELVIAPSGPLLALPFAVLPTAPDATGSLADAPWLLRRATLAYVPAAANFVALRKAEGTSAAQKPWFGFGDFQPSSLAQAAATYPPASCGESAALFANLPHLPYAAVELQAGAAIFGAGPGDELLGADYTVPNVETADLKNYQILHFATHALLPTDLTCQSQPAIVTSSPAGAASADDALLTTTDVTNLKLDANLILLSACNTGGGEAGGEALSGLARSFFYAGARALMVTQWSVNDQVSAYLVAETLSRIHAGGDGGAAGSLRAAQLALIGNAGHSMPAALADPFFWAAFTVIGDGGNTALSAAPAAGL